MILPDDNLENPEDDQFPSPNSQSGEDIFDKAYALEREGRYEDAAQIYQEALDHEGGDAWVNAHLANCLSWLGDEKQALHFFSLAIRMNPEYAWAFIGRSQTYSAMGNFQMALRDIESALALDPDNESAVYAEKGDILLKMDRYDDAAEAYEESLWILPDQPKVLANYGFTMANTGRIEEGIYDLKRAREIDPKDAWTDYYLGLVYQKSGNIEAAIEALGASIDLDGESYFPRLTRAMLFREKGDYNLACEDLLEMMQRWPDDAALYCARGEIYSLMNHWFDAVEDYTRAIELNSHLVEAWANRGSAYRRLGKNEDAVSDLSHAVDLQPHSSWPLAVRGEVYRGMRQWDNALKDFSAALDIDPKYAWALAHRAATYQSMDRLEEAKHDYQAALDLEPRNVWTVYMLGTLETRMGNLDAAEDQYYLALDIDPEYSWALTDLVDLYGTRDNYNPLIDRLKVSLEAHPGSIKIEQTLGLAYERAGDFTKAMACYCELLDNHPDDLWTLERRGSLHKMLFNMQAALEDFSLGVMLDPGNPRFWVLRAQAHRNLRFYEMALADYDQAISLGESQGWALGNRGLLYRLMGNPVRSEADIRKAMEKGYVTEWSWGQLGDALRFQGRLDEALTCYQQQIALEPESADGAFGLAMVNLALKNEPEFRKWIEKTILSQARYLQKHPENLREQLNLGLYMLVNGNLDSAKRQYDKTLKGMTQYYLVEEALSEGLEDVAAIRPQLKGLTSIRQLLNSALRNMQD